MKLRKGLLSVALILICISIKAQDNNIKWQIAPAIWGEIRLGYERVIKDGQTVEINIGYMFPRELPKSIYDPSTIEDYGGSVDLQNRISGYSMSGEYRFYTSSSKDAPRGFYVAPYLKYNKYKVESSLEIDYELNLLEFAELTPEQQAEAEAVNTGSTFIYHIDVVTNLNASDRQMGFGAMIGYQWLIKDRISIDLNMFGIGVDWHKVSIDYTSENIPVDYTNWEKELQAEVDDLSEEIGKDIELDVQSDKISASTGIVLPNLRMNLSIGFAF